MYEGHDIVSFPRPFFIFLRNLDATNSTRKRRHKIVNRFALHSVRVIFLEVLCTDERVLDENILNKVQEALTMLAWTSKRLD